MKMKFENPDFLPEKERIEKIKKQLQYALDNAISAQDLDDLIKRIRGLSPNESKKMLLDSQQLKDATAEFKTIVDFKEAGHLLEWDKKKMDGFNSYLDYIVEHENAHLNVAEQEGAIVHGYNIIMIREEDGRIDRQPAARYDVPEELSDDEKYRIEMLSVIAPKTYGNFLSPGDEAKIRRLHKEYKNKQ